MNLIFHNLQGILMEVYIDDVVIKSFCFTDHLADLRVALERMKKYGLRMNPFKCAFGVSTGHFLGFIVHEHGIQIDPKKVKSIQKFEEPACKRDVQKLLGKINYLRHFIANIAGKVDPLLPLVRLWHEKDFVWGREQRIALEKIRGHLSSPPMLKAPNIGQNFKLYMSAQEHVTGAAHMKENDGKEAHVAYVSQNLLVPKTRYVIVEKLCLPSYYACTKFRPYILSSTCTVVSQHDIMKHKLHKPILSSRTGKWAYSLIEYDLKFEPSRAAKGQVVDDFIIDHMVELNNDACTVEITPWRLFFDGSVCSKGRGIGCVMTSPHGMQYELFVRLEFMCTNN
jgi:ribonuclease HI